jgi:hypothetical protein
MKTINIKSRVNKIDKWFKSIGKKIMSIDLIDGQGRGVSIIRRLIILLLLLFSVYVLIDLLIHKGFLTTNEQRQLNQAIQQPLPSPVIALEQTEGSKVDNQTTEDIQKVKTTLQPLGKIEKYILSYGGRYDSEYLASLRNYCDEDTLKLVIAISVAETGMGKARMDRNTNWYGYFYGGDRQYDPDMETMSRVICNGISKYYSDVATNYDRAFTYTGGDNTKTWMGNVNEALSEMR